MAKGRGEPLRQEISNITTFPRFDGAFRDAAIKQQLNKILNNGGKDERDFLCSLGGIYLYSSRYIVYIYLLKIFLPAR